MDKNVSYVPRVWSFLNKTLTSWVVSEDIFSDFIIKEEKEAVR